MRIAIIGTGRMGRAVARCAEARGHQIVASIGREENRDGRGLQVEQLAGAEVAVEFTTPEAAPANLCRMAELNLPVVTGTTGWSHHLPRVSQVVSAHGSSLLYAANFSIGLQLMLLAAEALARAGRGLETFDAAITETHHTGKRDAPSGTALEIQRRLRASDPGREFPITALRLGSVPGIHRLLFDGAGETIDLAHTVRDRSVFAEGAVRAAEWLPGRPGVHTFAEMLSGGNL